MALESPEQRQQALSGVGVLLRIRVAEPMAAVWSAALRSAVPELWRTIGPQQNRAIQELQVAFEAYSAQATIEPQTSGPGYAKLGQRMIALTGVNNQLIDALFKASSGAETEAANEIAAAIAGLDRLVVGLHQWWGSVQCFDAKIRQPDPTPDDPPPPPAPDQAVVCWADVEPDKPRAGAPWWPPAPARRAPAEAWSPPNDESRHEPGGWTSWSRREP